MSFFIFTLKNGKFTHKSTLKWMYLHINSPLKSWF